jgi:SAM-dependent methyltransferase
MHPTAYRNGSIFFVTYSQFFIEGSTVVDIGSQNVNGTLKDHVPSNFTYIGVDFVPGNGVDVILEDPYKLPYDDESIDLVISSSCFEHSEFFWITFTEIIRCLKPSGLFYLNAPSGGAYHKYPIDAWRFYPDAGEALTRYAHKVGYSNVVLLESYIQKGGYWNDFCAVFLKDNSYLDFFPNRMIDGRNDFYNGKTNNHEILRPLFSTEKDEIINRRLTVRFLNKVRKIKQRLRL